MFRFKTFGPLTDGELSLVIDEHLRGRRAMEAIPAYKFKIIRNSDQVWVGDIDVRIGLTDNLYKFGGQIGYGVHSQFRGKGYAAKACLLIRHVALSHGVDELWITCNPENLASRKTCVAIGARLIDIVDIPPHNELYARGDRKKCRYYWPLHKVNSDIA